MLLQGQEVKGQGHEDNIHVFLPSCVWHRGLYMISEEQNNIGS